ncbi:MAG: pitrilysin family protein, partial [Moraxella sp.]|nr:pitrilysin family protein [Moraxella sp.]
NSPKGRPIIGAMSDIESLNESDLSAWYQRYYNPNNATLVLVGDVEPTEAMVWVRRYFDSLTSSSKAIAQPNLTQASHRGYHQFNSPQFVPTPQLSMAFNTPSLTSQTGATDAYALALLSDIADGGLSARFEKQLIREQGVLSSVGLSYSPFDKGDTLFTIHATPKEGVDLATAENAILAVLANINAQNIDDNELLRGQNNLVSSLVFDNDSMENQAVMLGMLATMGLPIDSMDKDVLPKKFAQVTKTDIEKVGKKYLTRDNLTTQYILPIEQNK